MGEAVGRGADVAIVTNDNPRSEDPRAIADAILPGPRGRQGARASSSSIAARPSSARCVEAEPGDVVLIAGKGHEPYQIIGATTLAVRRSRRGASARSRSGARREGGR